MADVVAQIGNKIGDITGEYPTENCLYAQLSITDEQCTAIASMVNTLAQGTIRSLFNLKSLNTDGKIIYGIHPFKLLSHIITHPEIKQDFTTIFKMWEWNPIRSKFLEGLTVPLANRHEAKRLIGFQDHLEGFAKEINKEPTILQEHIQREDWDGFFHYLL